MKSVNSLSSYLFLSMFVIVGSISMLVITPAFAGADDWSLVSAPPPPGPYRAVNLDFRIPGQGRVTAIGKAPRLTQSPENYFPETVAPAAGEQVNNQNPVNQFPQQVPGVNHARMPRPPVNVYPGTARYPVQTGRQNYSAMPPRGFYQPQSYQSEQVVPPPPVYDAMMQAPPGAYQSNAGH